MGHRVAWLYLGNCCEWWPAEGRVLVVPPSDIAGQGWSRYVSLGRTTSRSFVACSGRCRVFGRPLFTFAKYCSL